MAQIPALIQFVAGTVIKSADVNSNNSAITTAFNNTAVLTDTPTTIAVTHTWSVSQTFKSGMSVSGTATFVSAVTWTSGITITASGATVAGNPTFSNGIQITSGAAISATGVSITIQSIVATLASISTINSPAIVMASNITAPSISVGTGLDGVGGGINNVQVWASGVNVANFTKSANLSTAPFKMSAGIDLYAQSATLATSATSGFIYLSTVPATLSSVPAIISGSLAQGVVPICYDYTNNHILVYNSGWKSVTLS